MIVIGIDPGQKGGIARLANGQAPQGIVMPDIISVISFLSLEANVTAYDKIHIFIEKAQCMPKQGITSAFNYGVHYGELLGIVRCLGLPYTEVRPATWSRVMHAGTGASTTKQRSIEACKKLFPGINLKATERCKKDHDGMAEALLVAEYGRRVLNGKVS